MKDLEPVHLGRYPRKCGPEITEIHFVAAEFPPDHPKFMHPLPPVIVDVEAEDCRSHAEHQAFAMAKPHEPDESANNFQPAQRNAH